MAEAIGITLHLTVTLEKLLSVTLMLRTLSASLVVMAETPLPVTLTLAKIGLEEVALYTPRLVRIML